MPNSTPPDTSWSDKHGPRSHGHSRTKQRAEKQVRRGLEDTGYNPADAVKTGLSPEVQALIDKSGSGGQER